MDNPSPSSQQPLLLMVEDDIYLLDGLVDILEMTGLYKVLAARDGAQALAVLQNHIPDLIVSDIMMPNLDGHDLLKAVRAQRHFDHIPFIMLSAKNQDSDIRYSFALGADGYITKPFTPEAFLVTINKALATGRVNQANA